MKQAYLKQCYFPGFHEAIGDVMALSVSTPGHMAKINLIQNYSPNEQSDLNFLMRTALEKVSGIISLFVSSCQFLSV